MDDLYAFLSENTVKVEILDVEGTAYFTCTVVPYARTTAAIAAVCYVDLVAVAPRTTLLYLSALIVHAAALEVSLDELSERAALDECGEDLDRKSEI